MKNSERIYNLLTKHISGELSPAEENELNEWLAESSANPAILEQFKKVWQLTQPKESPLPDKSIDEEWQRLRDNLGLKKTNTIPFPKRSVWLRYLPAAAVFVAVISAAFWFTKYGEPKHEIYQTQNAQTKELHLDDGTHINLNHSTQIRYRASDNDSIRHIFLKGEAFFNVAKNEKPFVVQTENGRVRVLGTEFNVWTRNSETRVLVHEGTVSLTNTEDPDSREKAVVRKNQLAIARDSQVGVQNINQEFKSLPGWLDGRIVFNSTKLQEVAQELEYAFDCKIHLEQPELGNLSITANFQDKPVENILEAVCLALNLSYKQKDNGYVIYRDPL